MNLEAKRSNSTCSFSEDPPDASRISLNSSISSGSLVHPSGSMASRRDSCSSVSSSMGSQFPTWSLPNPEDTVPSSPMTHSARAARKKLMTSRMGERLSTFEPSLLHAERLSTFEPSLLDTAVLPPPPPDSPALSATSSRSSSSGCGTHRKRSVRPSLVGRVETFSRHQSLGETTTTTTTKSDGLARFRPRSERNLAATKGVAAPIRHYSSQPPEKDDPIPTGSLHSLPGAKSAAAPRRHYSSQPPEKDDPIPAGSLHSLPGGTPQGRTRKRVVRASILSRVETFDNHHHNSNGRSSLLVSPLTPSSSGGTRRRKRTVRQSLVARVEAFSLQSSEHRASEMLTKEQVKEAVRESMRAQPDKEQRFRAIVGKYEQPGARLRAEERQQAKDRQRTRETGEEHHRRKAWEHARAKWGHHTALPKGLGAGGIGYAEVRAVGYDFENFVPPVFAKTTHQRRLIEEAVAKTFCFAEFRPGGKAWTAGALEALVDAFEPLEAPEGEVLLHEGVANDTFSILEEGSLAFRKDEVVSTSVTEPGASFGEQALLYHSEPGVTVSVEEGGARLLRLDQRVYRGLLRTFCDRADAEKREALRGVEFLQEFFVSSNDGGTDAAVLLLKRLASLMTRHEFKEGDAFVADEDATFYLVKEGSMAATVQTAGDETKELRLEQGGCFGERALLGSLPRRNLVSVASTLSGVSPGVFYSIDREAMEDVLGKARLQKLQDARRILGYAATKSLLSPAAAAKAPTFRDAFLSAIDEVRLDPTPPREDEEDDRSVSPDVMRVEKTDPPALYVLREGDVVVTMEDSKGNLQHYDKTAGDVLGHELLEERTIRSASTAESVVQDSSSSHIIRKGGLTAKVKGDKPASIGILNVDGLRGLGTTGSKGRRSSARESMAAQLRNKVRTTVRDGVSLQDLEKIRLLGEGQFGEVWLVAADIYKTGIPEAKKKFALKSQAKDNDKIRIGEIRREIEVIRAVDHPQLADLVNVYEDDTNIHMLMGLIPGGEVWDRIYKEDEQGEWTCGLPEAEARFYTYVVADTLGYMHSKGFIFRDLKPENIMIDSEGYPVIVDFGFAKACPEGDMTWTFCGTPNYVAPEVITNSGHNRGVDFWALGVTLYEMVAGENPFFFEGMDQISLYDTICRDPHYPLKNEDEMSFDLVPLIDGLLEKDPIRRLGMLSNGIDDVLGHPWFDELDLTLIREKRWQAPWKPIAEGTEEEEDVSSRIEEESTEAIMTQMGAQVMAPNLWNDSFGSLQDSFGCLDEVVIARETEAIMEEGEEKEREDEPESTIEDNIDSEIRTEEAEVIEESKKEQKKKKKKKEENSMIEEEASATKKKDKKKEKKKDKKKDKKIKSPKKKASLTNKIHDKYYNNPDLRINHAQEMLMDLIDENESSEHFEEDHKYGHLVYTVKNPKKRQTKEQKAKSLNRRSTITAALGGYALDDSPIFGDGSDDFLTTSERIESKNKL